MLFLWIYIFFRIKLPRIKKDLIFSLDHGVEVQTCTEVVFLKSDEKTIFKTSLTHHSHETAYLKYGALGVLIPSLTTTSPIPANL